MLISSMNRTSGPADPLTVPDGLKCCVRWFEGLVAQLRCNLDEVVLVFIREGLRQVANQRVLDVVTARYWDPGTTPSGPDGGKGNMTL